MGRRERFFLEPRKKQRTGFGVKVNWMGLEGGTAAPAAGKILRVRIGASAIRPLEYFPFGLASPARADCIGAPRG